VTGDGEGDDARFTPDRDGFVEVVWLVSDGRAHACQVTTGIQSETHIEIVNGLEEGDDVVVGNYRAISRDLTDGAMVMVGGGEGRS
jgi:HlyD family secretion protein